MQNENVSTVLSDLITVSEDGAKGFTEARDMTTDMKLKELFGRCAGECQSAIAELQMLSRQYGETPKDSGSVSGALHRGWIKVKAGMEDTDKVLLEEVERGQDRAKAVYTKAMKENLPMDVKTIVQRQASGALRNHDLIRDLRNRYKEEA